jgi:4-hydroxybenzoate polyprenyltransferase
MFNHFLRRTVSGLVPFLLFTSIFPAACALVLCWATESLFIGKRIDLLSALHVFVFACTLVVYNVHYLIKKSTPQLSDQYAWVQGNKHFNYIFLGLGLLLAAMFAFQMPSIIWQICAVLALLSFAYSLPFLPFKNKHRLKDFGWLKILLLSMVWTSVTAILPMVYHQQIVAHYPFEILLRFVFLYILCLAFDIRDKAVDLEAGIFTIPNRIGLAKTYVLITILCGFYILFAFVQYFRFGFEDRLGIHVLTAMTTFWAIQFVRRHPSDKNYILFIDGQMLLNGLLILLL